MSVVYVLLMIVAIAIGGVLLYAATLPDQFRLSRSTLIQASPARIYPLIADMRRMNSWNPFAKSDPLIEITYGPIDAGTGAHYAWVSKGRAGQGRMEVLEAIEPTRITLQLAMLKPVAATNTVVFDLTSAGEATEVTWSMTGRHPYPFRVMSLVFNMDRMVGGEFDKGLSALKAQAEA